MAFVLFRDFHILDLCFQDYLIFPDFFITVFEPAFNKLAF